MISKHLSGVQNVLVCNVEVDAVFPEWITKDTVCWKTLFDL